MKVLAFLILFSGCCLAQSSYWAPSGISSSVQSSVTTSNVTMTTSGTFYDGPTTGSIAAGTWFVTGTVNLQTTSTVNAVSFTCKLWDGTTVFTSAQQGISESDNTGSKIVPITLSDIITEAGTSTIKISCVSDTNGETLLYQTVYSPTANASSISALKIK